MSISKLLTIFVLAIALPESIANADVTLVTTTTANGTTFSIAPAGTLSIDGAVRPSSTSSTVGTSAASPATSSSVIPGWACSRFRTAPSPSRQNSYLGNNAGSTGTANISGINAFWQTTSGLFVGNAGNGTLNISSTR